MCNNCCHTVTHYGMLNTTIAGHTVNRSINVTSVRGLLEWTKVTRSLNVLQIQWTFTENSFYEVTQHTEIKCKRFGTVVCCQLTIHIPVDVCNKDRPQQQHYWASQSEKIRSEPDSAMSTSLNEFLQITIIILLIRLLLLLLVTSARCTMSSSKISQHNDKYTDTDSKTASQMS